MKKIIVLLCLSYSVHLHSQNNTAVTKAVYAVPTEIGQPDGEKSIAVIGKNGGTIISADGKMELAFPEGALDTNMTISIQPSTNASADGIGKSYDFEPSGLTFLKPVQLIFHYSDTELDGSSPQLMSIASQNAKGVWCVLRSVKQDTLSKTVKGYIRHFSYWSLSWSFHFQPEKTRVKVSKKVRIDAVPMPIGEEVPGERHDAIIGTFGETLENPTWYANGVAHGNADNGTIDDAVYPMLETYVTYKAPDNLPAQNPVEIILEIKNVDLGISENNPKGTITKKCKIKVYDNYYEVKMISNMTDNGPAAWGGTMTYHDEGSFLVSLDDKTPTILEVKNNFEKLNYNTCTMKILNPGSNVGMIHVIGVKAARMTPANPPGQPYAVVEIIFIPAKAELTKFSYACKPPPGVKQSVSGVMSPNVLTGSMPAVPMQIKFIANDKEQVLYQLGTEGSKLYFKVSLKKLTE